MTGHPTSGPLPPRRNRLPGEVVGGVEEMRDSISWCSTMADVCCVFVACFVEREESLENSSPSPSWGNQHPSNLEMLLPGSFPSLAPDIFWHVSGLSEVFLKLFLFYCQNPSVSQCVSPQCGVKWRHDGFEHPTSSKMEEIWNKLFLSTSPLISRGFQHPKSLVWYLSPEICKVVLCSTNC